MTFYRDDTPYLIFMIIIAEKRVNFGLVIIQFQ